MKPAPRFLLLGHGGHSSLGAQARALGLRALLSRAFGAEGESTCTWSALDSSKAPADEGLELPYWRLGRLFRAVAQHDVVIAGGDESFQRGWNNLQLRWVSLAFAFARRLGRRTVLLVPSASPSAATSFQRIRALVEMSDLVVATSAAAEAFLRQAGVTRHVEVLCDPIFAMEPPRYTPAPVIQGERSSIGLAPLDFFAYPMKVQLRGHPSLLAGWPAYARWSKDRAAQTDELESAWADLATHAVRARGLSVKLIPSCELSAGTCLRIHARLAPEVKYHTKVIGDGTDLASVLSALPSLSLLLSSSYCVSALGLCSAVSSASLAGDDLLSQLHEDSGGKDSLLEQHEPRSTLLQLERLLYALSFDDLSNKVSQAEYLLDTLGPTCDQFTVVLQEWLTNPVIFKK